MQCSGVVSVAIRVQSGAAAEVNVYVSETKPLNFDMILGMNGLSVFGGVNISPNGYVCFFVRF